MQLKVKRLTDTAVLPVKAHGKWAPVVGYEELYAVSNAGEIWSVYSKKVLKPLRSNNGYMYVNLYKNGVAKHHWLHRIVACAFLGPGTDERNQVNHINGIKSDNFVENLEWVTQEENMSHAIETGLLRRDEVYKFDLEGNLLTIYSSSMKAARDSNVNYNSLKAALNGGRAKTLDGFIWSKTPKIYVTISKRVGQKNGAVAVEQFNVDGLLLNTFESVREASRATGINESAISKAASGKHKTSGGYIWKYK